MSLDPQQRQTLKQRLNESEQTLRAEIRASEDQRASESYADSPARRRTRATRPMRICSSTSIMR